MGHRGDWEVRTEGEGWRLVEVVRPTHVAGGLRHEWGTGGLWLASMGRRSLRSRRRLVLGAGLSAGWLRGI